MGANILEFSGADILCNLNKKKSQDPMAYGRGVTTNNNLKIHLTQLDYKHASRLVSRQMVRDPGQF